MIERDLEAVLRSRYSSRAESTMPPSLQEFVAAIPNVGAPNARRSWRVWPQSNRPARRQLVLAFLGVALSAALAGGAVLVASQQSSVPQIPADHGVFTRTGYMIQDRADNIGAVRLPNGQVLVVGGYGAGEASAELWDPSTGTFTPAGSLTEGSAFGSTATLLPDGKVLTTFSDADGTTRAATWDSTTTPFRTVADLGSNLWVRWATLLRDGRVLLVGQRTDDSAEPFALTLNPLSHAVTHAELPAGTIRGEPTLLTSLSDGRLLMVRSHGLADVWDPLAGSTEPAMLIPPGPDELPQSATLLSDGRVLVVSAKGYRRDGSAATTTVQVWDQTTGSASATDPLVEPGSAFGSATLLADGRVLFAGGEGRCLEAQPRSFACRANLLRSAELWDPATGGFSITGSLKTPRTGYQSTTLLRDGRVLVMGGFGTHDGSAELFELVP